MWIHTLRVLYAAGSRIEGYTVRALHRAGAPRAVAQARSVMACRLPRVLGARGALHHACHVGSGAMESMRNEMAAHIHQAGTKPGASTQVALQTCRAPLKQDVPRVMFLGRRLQRFLRCVTDATDAYRGPVVVNGFRPAAAAFPHDTRICIWPVRGIIRHHQTLASSLRLCDLSLRTGLHQFKASIPMAKPKKDCVEELSCRRSWTS